MPPNSQPAKPTHGGTAAIHPFNKTYNTTFYCLKYLPPENRNDEAMDAVSE